MPVDTLSPLPAAWYRFCYWEMWLLLVVFSIDIHPAGIILCMQAANSTQLNSTQIGLLSQVTYTAGKYDMKTTQSNNEGHWSGSLIWPSLVDTLYIN